MNHRCCLKKTLKYRFWGLDLFFLFALRLSVIFAICLDKSSCAQSSEIVFNGDKMLAQARNVFNGNIKLDFTLNDFPCRYYQRFNTNGSVDVRWETDSVTNALGEVFDPINQFRIVSQSRVYNVYPQQGLVVYLSYLDAIPPVMYGAVLSNETYKNTQFISTLQFHGQVLWVVSVGYDDSYTAALFERLKTKDIAGGGRSTNDSLFDISPALGRVPVKSVYYVDSSSGLPVAVSTMNVKGDFLDHVVLNSIQFNPAFEEYDFKPKPEYKLLEAKSPNEFGALLKKYSIIAHDTKIARKAYPMFDTDPMFSSKDTPNDSIKIPLIDKKKINERIDRENRSAKITVTAFMVISVMFGWFLIGRKNRLSI
jgi:hypothetical protein